MLTLRKTRSRRVPLSLQDPLSPAPPIKKSEEQVSSSFNPLLVLAPNNNEHQERMCRTTSAPKIYSCGHREDGYEYLDCPDYLKDGTCTTRETVDYWAGSKRAKGDCTDCASKKEEKSKETESSTTYESHISRLITEAEKHMVRTEGASMKLKDFTSSYPAEGKAICKIISYSKSYSLESHMLD
jgi:hypothetical protein